MFPVGGLLDAAIMKVFSLAVRDPFALMTWFYAATFVLAALTAAFVLEDLGLDRPVAAVFGLVFSRRF
jgi:hypothetical protein